MIDVFLSVLPIFLLILSGYGLQKLFSIEDNFWKVADKLTYYLFLPALLILKTSVTNFTNDFQIQGIYATVLATLAVAITIFATKAVFKIEDSLFTSIFQGGVRYNSYVFIAMSTALFAEDGVAICSIFIAYMIILTNIISVLVMNHYGNGDKKTVGDVFKTLLENPLIISTLIGLFLNYLNFIIPATLEHYMNYLAVAATPMSLLSVGAGLSLIMPWAKINATIKACAFKLLLLPLCTILLLKYFEVDGLVASVALLYSTVPCAGNCYILSRQMGGDSEAMASIITWTTLASTLTIPLWMM